MIATVSSSDFSWLIWEFIVSALAGVGGLIVWRGLWLEKHSKPKGELYSNLDDFWRGKSREKRGENWVIAGIVFEIFVAVSFAAKEGWEFRQAKIDAIKNDPFNQPISEMTATAYLVVKDTHFNELTNWSSRHVAQMALYKDDRPASFDILYADDFTKNPFIILTGSTAGDSIYGMRFHSSNMNAFWGTEKLVKAITNEANAIRMDVNFLPQGAQIDAGGVELVVNDKHFMFQIFPQIDTNAEDGTSEMPYVIFATNVFQKPER